MLFITIIIFVPSLPLLTSPTFITITFYLIITIALTYSFTPFLLFYYNYLLFLRHHHLLFPVTIISSFRHHYLLFPSPLPQYYLPSSATIAFYHCILFSHHYFLSPPLPSFFRNHYLLLCHHHYLCLLYHHHYLHLLYYATSFIFCNLPSPLLFLPLKNKVYNSYNYFHSDRRFGFRLDFTATPN